MIVVCDINEVWRIKPFTALADQTGVLGVAPCDWVVAWRRELPESEGRLEVLPVILPPSWASRMAWLGQRLLWKKILRKCMERGHEVECLVVTSPHYLPLLSMVPNGLKTIYYASDDYRGYEGWGMIAAKEKQLVKRVDHAFFISEELMERAKREYCADATKLSVSMNATEARFFPDKGTGPIPSPEGDLKRPIAGVIGGIGDRLDFKLLQRCTELDELGTLLLVGPLPEDLSPELEALLSHPKCVAIGAKPHARIHHWFQCLDVGLIPYVQSEFNRHCSPMRLFDHLASGSWIVATDACWQTNAFKNRVEVCNTNDSFVAAVRDCLCRPRPSCLITGISWKDRADELLRLLRPMSK